MEPMTSEELFEWCCNQNCEPYSNCDLCMYEKGRKDAIDELEPLFKLIVEFENTYICDEMCNTEYCEENCKYDCPQKECYLRYLDWLKEQK